jgi:hypothetical protein
MLFGLPGYLCLDRIVHWHDRIGQTWAGSGAVYVSDVWGEDVVGVWVQALSARLSHHMVVRGSAWRPRICISRRSRPNRRSSSYSHGGNFTGYQLQEPGGEAKMKKSLIVRRRCGWLVVT